MSRFRDNLVGVGLFVILAEIALLTAEIALLTVWVASMMFSGWALLGVCLFAFLVEIVAAILALAMLAMAHESRYPNDPDYMNFDAGVTSTSGKS